MPRRAPSESATREPLSYALGTPAKVRALRILTANADPMTQRELGRRAGIQHRSAQVALDELVSLGIAARQRGGRDYLVRLNTSHQLSAPLTALFAAEATQFLSLRRRLGEVANEMARRTDLISATLFGSRARGDDSPDSDCDLLLIARTKGGVDDAIAAIQAVGDELLASYGCRVRPIGYIEREARRAARQGRSPFPDVARDGLTLFGAGMFGGPP
jgi:predicted nucleotidyltransferase